jgi:sporulation protein YlmC with PRC-barrel domain
MIAELPSALICARAPSLNSLRHSDVLAREGRIGVVEDVYFDATRWTVRYLVVNAGGRLPGRRVVISPAEVEIPPSSAGRLCRPVSWGYEIAHARHRGVPHLRSGAELLGYAVQARDGAIGEIADFVIDDKAWTVREIVVDTLKRWRGGELRVHPAYVERVERSRRKMHLDLTRNEVRLSGAAVAMSAISAPG